jgi:hypothetical protein
VDKTTPFIGGIVKKVIALILSIYSLSYCANVVFGGQVSTDIPIDVSRSYMLADTGNPTIDSFDVGGRNLYFFPLSNTNPYQKGLMAKGFQYRALSGCLVSGDSVQVSWQLMSSLSLADTGTWTRQDTLISTGKASSYIDLTSRIGQFLLIEIKNLDSTPAMLKKLKLIFKDNVDLSQVR